MSPLLWTPANGAASLWDVRVSVQAEGTVARARARQASERSLVCLLTCDELESHGRAGVGGSCPTGRAADTWGIHQSATSFYWNIGMQTEIDEN